MSGSTIPAVGVLLNSVSIRQRCSCSVNAANVLKSLLELATIPEMRSTRDAFPEICRIFTEHLFSRAHLVDCFRNRRFFTRCFWQSLSYLAKMAFYFPTSKLRSTTRLQKTCYSMSYGTGTKLAFALLWRRFFTFSLTTSSREDAYH